MRSDGPGDTQSGMNAVPHQRGLALVAAHCSALDPGARSARERLDEALGEEFARKLVFALSGGASDRQRAGGFLLARPVFAA
jgi:hypothetical protein